MKVFYDLPQDFAESDVVQVERVSEVELFIVEPQQDLLPCHVPLEDEHPFEE